MDTGRDYLLTLAYVTAMAGKMHLMRRGQVSDEESVMLDTVAHCAFWVSGADWDFIRKVYDVVDEHSGYPPYPIQVAWKIRAEFEDKMLELAHRGSAVARSRLRATVLMNRLLDRLQRRVTRA